MNNFDHWKNALTVEDFLHTVEDDDTGEIVEHANFVCEECPARDVCQIDYFTTCGKQFRKWATTEVSK